MRADAAPRVSTMPEAADAGVLPRAITEAIEAYGHAIHIDRATWEAVRQATRQPGATRRGREGP